MTGGELPLMCLLDAAIRLIPGALGDVCSSSQDSFSLKDPKTGESLLDCPHYTRPANWRGLEVPSVLLSGHHEKIEAWRLEKAREATQKKLKNK